MKYKCIKDQWIEDVKVMSEGDIIVVSEDKKQIYNLTNKVDIRNVEIDMLISNLVNMSDNCECKEVASCCKGSHPFLAITDNMFEIYKKKNHDYGNSFDRSLDKFGLTASAIRIGDKVNRFESLVNKEAQVAGESIRDTLLDMANYAIMTVMWMDRCGSVKH